MSASTILRIPNQNKTPAFAATLDEIVAGLWVQDDAQKIGEEMVILTYSCMPDADGVPTQWVELKIDYTLPRRWVGVGTDREWEIDTDGPVREVRLESVKDQSHIDGRHREPSVCELAAFDARRKQFRAIVDEWHAEQRGAWQAGW